MLAGNASGKVEFASSKAAAPGMTCTSYDTQNDTLQEIGLIVLLTFTMTRNSFPPTKTLAGVMLADSSALREQATSMSGLATAFGYVEFLILPETLPSLNDLGLEFS